MSNIIFKRLFEVQFLHDYYLTTADGTSFFDRNEAEKREVLVRKLTHNLYDVRELFSISPIGTTKLKMSEYKLIVSRTALGFVVGTQVSIEQQGGETLYKPVVAFKEDLNLTFSIRSLIPYFSSMTNLGLTSTMPSVYYFTNKDKEELNETAVPNYKSLSIAKKAMAHQNGLIHEMGAVVDFGGTIREALQETDGTDITHWEDISDKRIMTRADKVLLPHNFTYTVRKEDGITQLDFSLEDPGGTPIKSKNFAGTEALEHVHLNFTRVDENDDASDRIGSGFYTLKVTANAGPVIAYPVHLNDAIYDRYSFGVLDIRADELNSPFSLLDAAGFLKTRIDAANVKQPHPVFEVRLKNRRTYWRYRQEEDFSAAEIAATTAHLAHQPQRLISLKPKALTETLVPFINGVSLMLPPPKIPSIRVENHKIFSEIFISPSNRLLNN